MNMNVAQVILYFAGGKLIHRESMIWLLPYVGLEITLGKKVYRVINTRSNLDRGAFVVMLEDLPGYDPMDRLVAEEMGLLEPLPPPPSAPAVQLPDDTIRSVVTKEVPWDELAIPVHTNKEWGDRIKDAIHNPLAPSITTPAAEPIIAMGVGGKYARKPETEVTRVYLAKKADCDIELFYDEEASVSGAHRQFVCVGCQMPGQQSAQDFNTDNLQTIIMHVHRIHMLAGDRVPMTLLSDLHEVGPANYQAKDPIVPRGE